MTKRAFLKEKQVNVKRWKDPFFYVYNTVRARLRFNTTLGKTYWDAPYRSLFFLRFTFLFIQILLFVNVVVRLQSRLEDVTLLRAKTILDLPKEQKDLKVWITEDNLKKASFLTSRVGTLCPFIKFWDGVPLGIGKSKKHGTPLSDSEDEGNRVRP